MRNALENKRWDISKEAVIMGSLFTKEETQDRTGGSFAEEYKEQNKCKIQEWDEEQEHLKKKQVFSDSEDVRNMLETVNCSESSVNNCGKYYVGGVDISFVKDDTVNACAALVVVDLHDIQKVVYEDYEMIKLTEPYIPGYLAFREAGFLEDLYRKVEKTPYCPKIIFVDGNGILHPKAFGLACHLGVLLDIPCVGVAKKLFLVDGMSKDSADYEQMKKIPQSGGTFPIIGKSGKEWGKALRSCKDSFNPIYVSVGHKITLASAVKLVHHCCKFRVPEPIRKADINSREYLRNHFS